MTFLLPKRGFFHLVFVLYFRSSQRKSSGHTECMYMNATDGVRLVPPVNNNSAQELPE